MALNNILVLLTVIFTPLISFGAYIEPVEIISKQDLTNLRFVSKDSNFTYYQKPSGGLFYSTNYSVKKVIESNPYAQFKISMSSLKKKIIITRHNYFHQYYGPNIDEDIYLANYNDNKVELLTKGTFPLLHLNDDWISYFKPSTNKIAVKKLTLPTFSTEIQLNNKIDSFFIPKRVSVAKDTLIYTDINSKGQQGVFFINLKSTTPKLVYQATTPGKQIELCLNDTDLYVGVFSNNGTRSGSEIYSIPKTTEFNQNISMNKIYESKLNDIGQINCHYSKGKILFIKNYGTNLSTIYEIAEVDLVNKKTTQLTNVRYISSFYDVDGRIMLSYNGKQYLLFGERSLKSDQLPSEMRADKPVPVINTKKKIQSKSGKKDKQ